MSATRGGPVHRTIRAPTVGRLFEGRPKALRKFNAIRERIEALGPVTMRVTKTQVSFSADRGFAWVWLPQMWVKAPEESVTLSFALPHRVEHPRVKDAAEPYPGRWINHVIIGDEEEVDETIVGWLAEAYAFGKKTRLQRG